MKTEKLYFKNGDLLHAHVLTELANIVRENGGQVLKNDYSITELYAQFPYEVMSKNISEISRIEHNIAKYVGTPIEENLRNALKKKANENLYYENLKNTKLITMFPQYVRFIFNDEYYYVQHPDYVITDFKFIKFKVEDKGDEFVNPYNHYIDDLGGTSMYPNRFEDIFDKNEIRKLANMLFEKLVSAPCSEIVVNTKRFRVLNTYNNGYHYETVSQKEIRKTVIEKEDFWNGKYEI